MRRIPENSPEGLFFYQHPQIQRERCNSVLTRKRQPIRAAVFLLKLFVESFVLKGAGSRYSSSGRAATYRRHFSSTFLKSSGKGLSNCIGCRVRG